MRVAVVTPTIGSPVLKDCLDSVQRQSYKDLTHYVFLDGEKNFHKIYPVMSKVSGQRDIQSVALEENVGKGWYGHRVYAACSFLVNADLILYLDEDNWFDENHVETLVDTIKTHDYSWAFSLRKIYNKSGEFLCEDNCESLGLWNVYDEDRYHIDTSCFAVKREVAVQIGHAWYGQWGADRQFFMNVRRFFPNYGCSGKHTACYRLDGNAGSVQQNYFDIGNKMQYDKYQGRFPWKNGG
jgi:glycosyltransferase involved in cell wall biosynthesis